MKKKVSILGIPAELTPIQRNTLKGLNADLLLGFYYYSAVFRNQSLCIIQPKRKHAYTPSKYKKIIKQIEEITGIPVAVLLDSLAYYERERLINQGIYFIVSDKYAFLPMLISNVLAKKKGKTAAKLTPAAQYLLLYHLLSEGEKEFTIKDLTEIMSYSYLALSRAVVNLEDCGLCRSEKDSSGTKIIRFVFTKRELWEKTQKQLSSPVKKVYYTDVLPDKDFNVSGINALSQYSNINPEQYGSFAVWDKSFVLNDLYNEIEGNFRIEVWKYPTSMPSQNNSGTVDKLSLYLSLKNESDARIEKELEILIEEMKW
ncbi:MAG: MarR family transcriptional regulator [Prevotellaceae bacterium]|jgi:DNA-binding MarR family transcriptional regulator|nr:MarR family transcriptional regulator [Prevotellaceae bacterium]